MSSIIGGGLPGLGTLTSGTGSGPYQQGFGIHGAPCVGDTPPFMDTLSDAVHTVGFVPMGVCDSFAVQATPKSLQLLFLREKPPEMQAYSNGLLNFKKSAIALDEVIGYSDMLVLPPLPMDGADAEEQVHVRDLYEEDEDEEGEGKGNGYDSDGCLSDSSSDSSSDSDSDSDSDNSVSISSDQDQDQDQDSSSSSSLKKSQKQKRAAREEKEGERAEREQRKSVRHGQLLQRERRFFNRILDQCRVRERVQEKRRAEDERKKKRRDKQLAGMAATFEKGGDANAKNKKIAVAQAQALEVGIPPDWTIETVASMNNLLILGGGKQLAVLSLLRRSSVSNDDLLKGMGGKGGKSTAGAPAPSSSRKSERRSGTFASMQGSKIESVPFECLFRTVLRAPLCAVDALYWQGLHVVAVSYW